MEQKKIYQFPTNMTTHMVYQIVGSMIWGIKIKKCNLTYEKPDGDDKGYYQVCLSDVDTDKLDKAVEYIRFSIKILTRE